MQVVLPFDTRTEVLCQSDADDAVLQVGGMQFVVAVAIENAADVGEGVEVVFHTFDGHHSLLVLIDGECHVLDALR